MTVGDAEQAVSTLVHSLRLKHVRTTLVDFMAGDADPAVGTMTSGVWFSGHAIPESGVKVVGHVLADAPGGKDSKPRSRPRPTLGEVIFYAHVHVEGIWTLRDDAKLDASILSNEPALKFFASSTGRLNLYPYLRATVSGLCDSAQLQVPPLPPITFDPPSREGAG